MKSKFTNSFLLLTLAKIFTIGLTFASIELKRIADNIIRKTIKFVYSALRSLGNFKSKTAVITLMNSSVQQYVMNLC